MECNEDSNNWKKSLHFNKGCWNLKNLHFMIWLCPKSIGWLLFTFKKAQMWKVFWWGFQNFAYYFKFSRNIFCTIRSLMPTLNEASYFNLVTMMLLLHLTKRLKPTQRPPILIWSQWCYYYTLPNAQHQHKGLLL
jgi:hypothetical protein